MNNHRYFFAFSLCFACFATIFSSIQACTYAKQPPIEPNMACDTLMPTYVDGVKPIIDANCSYPGCHAAGYQSGDFTNYSSMKSRLDGGQFQLRTLQIKDMPPSYASGPKELTPEELAILECWLQNGYPEQ